MTTTIPLAYSRSGAGAPLVLVHGFPLDGSIWDELVPLLEDEVDLIRPDLRGFGDTEPVETQYTTADMADDIAALLDRLELPAAYLAGHSMGGYVALAFAKKYPEKVRGLALVSSQAGADSPERKQGRYDTAAAVAERGPGVVVDGMAAKLTADPRVQQFAQEVMGRQGKAAIIGGLKAMAEREDLRSALTEFDFPIVVLHGEADALIPVEMAREAHGRAEKAEKVELPGVGHMPMMEAAQGTAWALRRLTDG
jgi:pimeloyl-ACP methyl ester carboxylesterase